MGFQEPPGGGRHWPEDAVFPTAGGMNALSSEVVDVLISLIQSPHITYIEQYFVHINIYNYNSSVFS